MPYKFNESRRHKIPKARYRVTNWPEYDAALVRRGSLTVWLTEQAVSAWHAPATCERGGQAVYAEQGRYQQRATVAVLDISRMHNGVEHQACGVDKDMSLLTFDLLPVSMASYPCGSMQTPLFRSFSRFGYRSPPMSD
jgi:hypothetical protein